MSQELDAASRMLGAVDGFAHALINVRAQIASLNGRYAPMINPHHTRKLQRRADILRPLLAVESYLVKSHADCQAAYRAMLPASPLGEQ